ERARHVQRDGRERGRNRGGERRGRGGARRGRRGRRERGWRPRRGAAEGPRQGRGQGADRAHGRSSAHVFARNEPGEAVVARGRVRNRQAYRGRPRSDGLCESPLTFQAIIIWRDELNEGKVLLRDIIDLEATYAGPDAKAMPAPVIGSDGQPIVTAAGASPAP